MSNFNISCLTSTYVLLLLIICGCNSQFAFSRFSNDGSLGRAWNEIKESTKSLFPECPVDVRNSYKYRFNCKHHLYTIFNCFLLWIQPHHAFPEVYSLYVLLIFKWLLIIGVQHRLCMWFRHIHRQVYIRRRYLFNPKISRRNPRRQRV